MLTLRLLSQRQALNGKIVALSAASSEDYLLSISANELSYLVSRIIDGLPSRISPVMQTGRVTK